MNYMKKVLLIGGSMSALASADAMAQDMTIMTLDGPQTEQALLASTPSLSDESYAQKIQNLKDNLEGRNFSFGRDRKNISVTIDLLVGTHDPEIRKILERTSDNLKIEATGREGIPSYHYNQSKITIPNAMADMLKTDEGKIGFSFMLLHEMLHNVQNRKGYGNLTPQMNIKDSIMFEKFSEAEAKSIDTYCAIKLFEKMGISSKELEQGLKQKSLVSELQSSEEREKQQFGETYTLDYLKTYHQRHEQNKSKGYSDERAERKAHLYTRASQIKKTLNNKYPVWTKIYDAQARNNTFTMNDANPNYFPAKSNPKLKKYLIKSIQKEYGNYLKEGDLTAGNSKQQKGLLKTLEQAKNIHRVLPPDRQAKNALKSIFTQVSQQPHVSSTLPKTINFATKEGR